MVNQAPPVPGGFKKAGSGISTNTVLLSRKKMGFSSIPKQETPIAPDEPVASEATTAEPQELPLAEKMSSTMVWCPKCECGFEINSDFYGILAECSECAFEFKIPDAPTIEEKPVVAPPRTRSHGYRKETAKKVKQKSNVVLYSAIAVIITVLAVAAIVKLA
jgi:hypothetical protein